MYIIQEVIFIFVNLNFTNIKEYATLLDMKPTILVEAGLTKAQTTAYISLLTHSPITPPALAKIIGESRTNTYKILEQLEDIDLVIRDESSKKIRYLANNPSALTSLIAKQEREIQSRKKRLQNTIADLEKTYFENLTQPGVSFKQGTEGIINVFEDYTKTNENLFMIRSWKDRDYIGKGVLSIWRKQPSTKGLTTHFIGPDTESASSGKMDKTYLIDKTWIQEEDYTAPVEWCAYGDKLAIISYGDEASSTIVQSPQIANAFKQLHCLLAKRQRQSPGYDKFPIKARLSDDPIVEDSSAYKSVVKKREKFIDKN